MHTAHRSLRRCGGFTLIEIAVVLVIIAIMIAMAAFLTRGITGAQKRSTTTARLTTVDSAIAQFVMVNKRLPCPADGTVPTGTAGVGTENGAPGACNQQNGVVPWTALGLPETDASDGWDRRLTYRVFPGLTAANGMDMSKCDPAGTEPAGAMPRACNLGCVATNLNLCTPPAAFLTANGLAVRDAAGSAPPLMNPATGTGAAYVVISHGESGGGGYLPSGVLAASSSTDGDAEKDTNYASRAYPPVNGYYVDNTLVDIPGPGHFDDIVSRPSIMTVAAKAGLGPRAH